MSFAPRFVRLTKFARNSFKNLINQRSLMTALDPVQAKAMHEDCILVDENDKVLGKASKYDCHRKDHQGNLLLHRAFSVFLFNSKGELLLQKRSKYKVTFPNHWTNTCCSHPLHTIDRELEEKDALGVRIAAQRRMNHELGIPLNEINPEKMKYLTRIHYRASEDNLWGEHEIDYIIFLQTNVKLDPNPEEVSEIQYVTKEKLDQFIVESKDPITPWFKLIVQNKLKLWWNNLDKVHDFKDNAIHRFL